MHIHSSVSAQSGYGNDLTHGLSAITVLRPFVWERALHAGRRVGGVTLGVTPRRPIRVAVETSPLRSKPRQLATSNSSRQFLCLEKKRPGRLIFPRCQPVTSSWRSPQPLTAKEYLPAGTGQIENLPSPSVTALYSRSEDDKCTVACFSGLPSLETTPAMPSSSIVQAALSHCAAANDESRSRTASRMN